MEPKICYWLTPVNREGTRSGRERIAALVGVSRTYALGKRTHGRAHIKKGDWMCFYVPRLGVVGHARVLEGARHTESQELTGHGRYPWVIRFEEPSLYLDEPVRLDSELRANLHALSGRDPRAPWGWYVMSTRKVDEADFRLLIRASNPRETS